MPTRREFGSKTIVPDEYVAVIGDEEIDLSIIPSKMLLKITEKAQLLAKEGKTSLNDDVDLVVEICQLKNPNVTKDMILELPLNELLEFIEFVMAPIREAMPHKEPAADDTKNSEQSV